MPTTSTSYKISDSLYLVRQPVSKTAKKAEPVAPPTNHVLAIDCSGSMYSDLPKVREHIKKKLPKLMKEDDTLSIIWFSGRNECDVLLEDEPLATLSDLKQVYTSLDRWLKTVGLTGFKQPLEKALEVVERLKAKHPKSVNSFSFMSDGQDNCWPRADVLKAMSKAAGGFDSVTIVEYGYYGGRDLLAQMASVAGGSLIFSEDFDRYAPQIEALIQKKVSGAKRIEVPVKGDVVGGFAYALSEGDLITYEASGETVAVPEDLTEVVYLAPKSVGTVAGEIVQLSKTGTDPILGYVYAAVSLFAVRMKPDVVFPLLKSLGDVKYIEDFSNCFGKQKYSEVMDATKEAAFGKNRFLKGWDPTKVPREDAFTVLEALNLLQHDEESRVLMEHPDYKYSKIGRARLDVDEVLTPDELAEKERLTTAMTSEKDPKKLKEISTQLAALLASKKDALKLVYDPAPNGYPVSTLTFNEDRPNVSILVRRPATVDISARIPDEFKGKLPEKFPVTAHRNYTLVKDGLVHLDKLPLKLSVGSRQVIKDVIAEGRAPAEAFQGLEGDGPVIIDLRSLPVINRKQVKSVSAKSFFTTQYNLSKAQAAQKVYNGYLKDKLPAKVSASFTAQYGAEAATWLKEQGITDNGFQPPKTTIAAAKDKYMGKELHVSLKGLSSLPSIKEAKEKMAKAAGDKTGKTKLTASVGLMKASVEEVEAFLASDAYTKAADKDAYLKAWLEPKARNATQSVRGHIFSIATTTFCTVVGQAWFSEFKSIDENALEITVDGEKIACKAEMKEVEYEI